MLVCEHHLKFHRFEQMSARKIVKWFNACDAFRRPERFFDYLVVCLADSNGRGDKKEKVNISKVDFIANAAKYCNDFDVKPFVDSGLNTDALVNRIHSERVSRLKNYLKNEGE